jgi:hypothetical protein
VPEPAASPWGEEPDDAELERWAAERRVLCTLLLWAGMTRELDCLSRLVDLVATTGLRAGLVLTTATFEHGAGSPLPLLAAPVDRGGVLGRLELLLASLGTSVGAESELPDGVLTERLTAARAECERLLPATLVPRGWWPLLDAPLVPHRASPIGRRGVRPVLRFRSRGERAPAAAAGENGAGARDLRGLTGDAVRRLRLQGLFEERRPFDDARPGELDPRVPEAVSAAGFAYGWSKVGFGTPRIVHRSGDFAALSLTAGRWDGWSPFYTVGSAGDVARAETRLLARREPGWLVGTVDAPLWALSGESLEHGERLYRIAARVAGGGATGRLVNVTPNTIARYARLLADRAT